MERRRRRIYSYSTILYRDAEDLVHGHITVNRPPMEDGKGNGKEEQEDLFVFCRGTQGACGYLGLRCQAWRR